MLLGKYKKYNQFKDLYNKAGDNIEGYKKHLKAGTHNGRFHADEVMATAILKEIFDVEVIRTRNAAILDELELVYDVGGGEFDHHQNEKEFRDSGTPYAACGLIWERMGREIISSKNPLLTEADVEAVFETIDAVLIEGIDAADNGLRTSEVIIPMMNIASIVSGFNPSWDSQVSEDQAFSDAVQVASDVLKNLLEQQFSLLRAKADIQEAYQRRGRPELLVLDQAYPWQRALYEIDQENEILFVIYPREDQYLIQTVRRGGGTYENKKSLPLSWAGKRDEELSEVIGIDDSVFCHSARFIAGARSFESIMKMADIALAEPKVLEEPVETAIHGFFDALRKVFLGRHSSGKR